MAQNDLEMIRYARRLVKRAAALSCEAYSELCATKAEQTAYLVLDGELRMDSKLAELESKLISSNSVYQ